MAYALAFIPLPLIAADPLREAIVGGSAGAVGAFLAAALLGIILHTLRGAGGNGMNTTRHRAPAAGAMAARRQRVLPRHRPGPRTTRVLTPRRFARVA